MKRRLLTYVGRVFALTALLAGAILAITHALGRPVDVVGVVGIAGAVVFALWSFMVIDERTPGTEDNVPKNLEAEPARAFRSFQVLRTQIRGSLSSSDHRADPFLSDLGEIARDRVRRYRGAGELVDPLEMNLHFSPDLLELLIGHQLVGEVTLERLGNLISDLRSIDRGGSDGS